MFSILIPNAHQCDGINDMRLQINNYPSCILTKLYFHFRECTDFYVSGMHSKLHSSSLRKSLLLFRRTMFYRPHVDDMVMERII